MGKYNNIGKTISRAAESWHEAADRGLIHIRTRKTESVHLETASGLRFINMISCSYLGLNRHPKIIQGAIRGIEREGVMSTSSSRLRIAPALLDEAEQAVAEVFGAEVYLTPSCFYAHAAVLPVLASGHFTDGEKPFMVFDKNAHFSINIMKPVCGDETDLVVAPHNDMGFLEDACKKHPLVAFVTDGAFSMGDSSPVEEWRRLQDRYGTFVYLDDSHSISVCGKRGEGLVRSRLEALGDRTVVVGSLAKAFGATGATIMLGNARQREILDYSTGPLAWSQMVNAAGLGAIKAAAEIHLTDELGALQARLRANMARFDQLVPTANAGSELTIRIVEFADPTKAIIASKEVFRRGFYTSPVFFPIVAEGRAGMRLMLRADMEESDVDALCDAVRQFTPAARPHA